MPKRCLLPVLMVLLSSVVSAQVKIGIMGGPQSANILEQNSIPGWDTAKSPYYSPKSGIHLGFMIEIPFTQTSKFYFEPAILYSEKGRSYAKTGDFTTDTSYLSVNETETLTLRYFDIPLNVAYKLPLNQKKTSHFLLSAGPYLSLYFNGKDVIFKNNQYYNFKDSTKNYSEQVNKTVTPDVGKKENSYATFGYGLNARAGFEFGSITLTGFYSMGLDNLYYATYDASFKHRVYGASLGIWLGQIKEPVVIKDKDQDGITDDKDACPTEAGAAITNGCPDRDADGVADIKDHCPDTAGLARYDGCPIPDSDHDGIDDEADKCPRVAGIAKYNGCPVPDLDGDGVNDEADKCPTVMGLAKYDGCPIPDSDGDGLNDEVDKCPTEAGPAENNGCPVVKEEIRKQVNYAAENIFFELNSAVLLKKSYAPLLTVVELLKANEALSITVDGHTDNTGTEAANLKMSARRAQAVKDYFVKNGIEASRISTHGYGQERPVADNGTKEGRARNRRVELQVK